MFYFPRTLWILLIILPLIGFGCAAKESTPSAGAPSQTTKPGPPAAPDTQTPDKPAAMAEAKTTPLPASPPDTIDWHTPGLPLPAPGVGEVDREGVAESLGLVGPLVAVGGKGSDVYILVFDPAGVLVGALPQKEVKQNPLKLEKLVLLAHERAEIQNDHALTVMNAMALRSASGNRP